MLWKNPIPANIQNKHTCIYAHLYIHIYTTLLRYILQSLQCYINDTTNIFPRHCCNRSFPVCCFSPFEVRSSSHQMELHRFLNWVKTHSGKHQLNSQNKNYSVSKVFMIYIITSQEVEYIMHVLSRVVLMHSLSCVNILLVLVNVSLR